MAYSFRAPLWVMNEGVWHFVTVPEAMSDEIDERTTGLQGGFGSVKVEVTVGSTTWSTSLFPSTEAGAYVLPVKKAVRTANGVGKGDEVDVELRIVGLERPGAATA